MSEAQDKVEALFEAVVALETEAQRADYLSRECPDPELRREVESLLACHENPDGVFSERTVRMEEGAFEGVGATIDRYKVLEEVGEGGCGVVYVAEQTEPVRRRVALKVIKLGMDTKAVVARFEAERQALAMMDHPNIAKVFDAGTTAAGRPYFVMELVRGIRITEYCDQANLSTKERLDLFIKVCQAIQHAHQKGIIHRDIKPSNILVTLHDGVPVPKVIDFGIAKATEGRLTDATVYTQLHQFIGTPAYMSPEQAEMSGLDIDTRSDIYSLGVLLYELLAGKPPFDGNELVSMGLDAMRKTIREKEPPRPSTRLATLRGEELTTVAKRRSVETSKLANLLRGDLDWVVMRCLEKERARRYDTANGLAADIRRHLNNEPITARPPSAAYRFQKAYRRNKLLFTAVTAVLAALTTGAAVSTWQAIRATQAAQAESEQRMIADGAKAQAQAKQQEAEAAQRLAESERQRADVQARKAIESEQHSRRLLYAADMNLVQQSLQQNNLGRALRLLDRHRPQSGEEDLRGWEWRYLWQRTRSSALATLTKRPARGFSVSFSPDGSRLAVGWYDGHVDLWDVPGRRRVRALVDRDHPHFPGRVAFSPVGQLLAATSEPDGITLYDLDSGRETLLWRAPEARGWHVRELSFSQDGSRLVIYGGSFDGTGAVSVINVSSATIEKRHSIRCRQAFNQGAAHLSPDGQRLYLSRFDPSQGRISIQCLDLATDQELWQTEPQSGFDVTTLALSPDGRVLASNSEGNEPTIRLWDAETGQLLRQLEGHTGSVFNLAFSSDGRQLISAAADQTLRCWDTGTWTETRVLRGHRDEVTALAISEATHLIASASKDGDLMLWSTEGQSDTHEYIHFPQNPGFDPIIPLDHSRFLVLSPDEPPKVIDLKRNSAPVSLPGLGASTNVLASYGTNIFITWNGTNQILVRELQGSEFVARGAITMESGLRPTALAYCDARQLLAWSESFSSTTVHLANLVTPDRWIELKSDVGGVMGLSFSEDGNHLGAATGALASGRLWNVDTGKIVVFIQEPVTAGVFAAGGQVAFTGLQTSNDILFADLSSPSESWQRLPGGAPCWSLATSPDGGLVVGATLAGEVRVFKAATGEQIESIHGHMGAIRNCAFSPDGKRLLTASVGDVEGAKLWDVGTWQELLTLKGAGRGGFWTADGDAIILGAWPGGFRPIQVDERSQVWHAPSWEEIAAAEVSQP